MLFYKFSYKRPFTVPENLNSKNAPVVQDEEDLGEDLEEVEEGEEELEDEFVDEE